MDKVQIPLTIYKGGRRTQLGMVEVRADGEFIGQVSKDHWPVVKHLFEPNVGELSIGPFAPGLTPEAVVIEPKV